jgi:hypothetical protein
MMPFDGNLRINMRGNINYLAIDTALGRGQLKPEHPGVRAIEVQRLGKRHGLPRDVEVVIRRVREAQKSCRH